MYRKILVPLDGSKRAVAKMKINSKPASFEKLRRQAEKRLLERNVDLTDMPLGDINELVHELEVHQIELEMQNEELRQAQLDLEAAR